MSDRHFTCFDQDRLVRAVEPDFAAAVDEPWEIMAEEFGIPLGAAKAIHAWHAAAVLRAETEVKYRTLSEVVGTLIQPADNLRAKVWGLAFSFGLPSRMNGVRSMDDVGQQIGCTRALISHYKRFWDRLLFSTVQIYGKSAATCAKLSQARLEFVRTGKTRAQRDAAAEEGRVKKDELGNSEAAA